MPDPSVLQYLGAASAARPFVGFARETMTTAGRRNRHPTKTAAVVGSGDSNRRATTTTTTSHAQRPRSFVRSFVPHVRENAPSRSVVCSRSQKHTRDRWSVVHAPPHEDVRGEAGRLGELHDDLGVLHHRPVVVGELLLVDVARVFQPCCGCGGGGGCCFCWCCAGWWWWWWRRWWWPWQL